MEVGLIFLLEGTNTPENNFALALNLRLSESTDIVRIADGCLHLFIPYLGLTVETVKTKLTQVPPQDLCWVSDAHPVFSHCVEHQNNHHTIWSNGFDQTLFVAGKKIIATERATIPKNHHQNHCHLIYTWNLLPKCIC
jgi:hypothetical protein